MTATLYGNTEIVTVAFLEHVLAQSGIVDTELPGDQDSWAATGFVQVIAPHAGDANAYAPIESPVVEIRCWACDPGGRLPPWQQANQLAQRIRRRTFTDYTAPVTVTLPADYEQAIVDTARLVTHPARVTGDDSSFACYRFDFEISWRGAGLS